MKWFYQFLAPHPSGGVGLEPQYVGKNLAIGWLAHQFLEEYYNTFARHGEPILDASLAYMDIANQARKHEWNPHEREDIISNSRMLGQRYFDFYGPGGVCPETRDLEVALTDDGQPLVEWPFELNLEYGNYVYTARLDGVVWYRGNLCVLEHKTTSPSGVRRLFNRMSIDTQATGYTALLRYGYPDLDTHGVLVNAIIKGNRRQGSPFERDVTSRTRYELDKFKLDCVMTLKEIEEHVNRYHDLVQAGMDHHEAARHTFVMNTARCVEMWGVCPYYGLCKSLGYESKMKGNYRVRSMDKRWSANVPEGLV